MKTHKHNVLLVFGAALVALVSCTQEPPRTGRLAETSESGKLEVVCDAEIAPMIEEIAQAFTLGYPDATITVKPASAGDATQELTTEKARCIVSATNPLLADDTHPIASVATDALVLYVDRSFPYDTMSSVHVSAWLAGTLSEAQWKAAYPRLEKLPVFTVPDPRGSVAVNVQDVMLKGATPQKGRLSALPTRDSIRTYQRRNVHTIGIGYLSQFARDSSVKMLRLSYLDSAGAYVNPKPVHVGYLAQKQYPYPVTLHTILRDKITKSDLASGFMAFISRDKRAQQIFFDAGIQPGYARLVLNVQD